MVDQALFQTATKLPFRISQITDSSADEDQLSSIEKHEILHPLRDRRHRHFLNLRQIKPEMLQQQPP